MTTSTSHYLQPVSILDHSEWLRFCSPSVPLEERILVALLAYKRRGQSPAAYVSPSALLNFARRHNAKMERAAAGGLFVALGTVAGRIDVYEDMNLAGTETIRFDAPPATKPDSDVWHMYVLGYDFASAGLDSGAALRETKQQASKRSFYCDFFAEFQKPVNKATDKTAADKALGAGDVVRLKSGSRPVVIESIETTPTGSIANVVWYETHGSEFQETKLALATLERAPATATAVAAAPTSTGRG